jgi:hypothetical protein
LVTMLLELAIESIGPRPCMFGPPANTNTIQTHAMIEFGTPWVVQSQCPL